MQVSISILIYKQLHAAYEHLSRNQDNFNIFKSSPSELIRERSYVSIHLEIINNVKWSWPTLVFIILPLVH